MSMAIENITHRNHDHLRQRHMRWTARQGHKDRTGQERNKDGTVWQLIPECKRSGGNEVRQRCKFNGMLLYTLYFIYYDTLCTLGQSLLLRARITDDDDVACCCCPVGTITLHSPSVSRAAWSVREKWKQLSWSPQSERGDWNNKHRSSIVVIVLQPFRFITPVINAQRKVLVGNSFLMTISPWASFCRLLRSNMILI